jgi:hypothetical protein
MLSIDGADVMGDEQSIEYKTGGLPVQLLADLEIYKTARFASFWQLVLGSHWHPARRQFYLR